MTLIKTSFLNGMAVVIKVITLLGLNKILAAYVGPAGYAVLGQFQNFIQLTTIVSGGSISVGVTKYAAEYNGQETQTRKLFITAFIIASISSVVVALFVVVFRRFLSEILLHDAAYADVFIWLSVGLVFFSFNSLLLAILNGKKQIKQYVYSNVIGSILSLVVAGGASVLLGLRGALIGLVVFQSVAFFVTLLISYRMEWFNLLNFYGRFDRVLAKKLFSFACMSLTTAIVVPTSHMMIRTNIAEELSLHSAGIWEAAMRVSLVYLTFVSSVFSVYFVPRFSEIKTRRELTAEVCNSLRVIITFLALTLPVMYASREGIVRLLFTEDFSAVGELIGFQLLGDFFKAIAFVFAYFLIARAKAKYFIFGEICFSLLFVISIEVMIPMLGLAAVAYGYLFTYASYLIYMYFCFLVVTKELKYDFS